MTQSIIDALAKWGLAPELIVFLVATLPIIELRGAIPLGINLFNFPWYKVVPLAIFGNLVPVPFILVFLEKVAKFLSRSRLFKKFFDWLFTRTRKKSRLIEEYEMIGLMLFVAIPLPVTGAWTGAVAAFLLGLKFKGALIAIFLGVLIAATVVTVLSLLGIWGAIIAGLALSIMSVLWIIKKIQPQKPQRPKS